MITVDEIKKFLLDNQNNFTIFYFDLNEKQVTSDIPDYNKMLKTLQVSKNGVEFRLTGLYGLRTYIGERTFDGQFDRVAFRRKFDEYGVGFTITEKFDGNDVSVHSKPYIKKIKYKNVYYTGFSVEGLTFFLTTETINPAIKRAVSFKEDEEKELLLRKQLIELEHKRKLNELKEHYNNVVAPQVNNVVVPQVNKVQRQQHQPPLQYSYIQMQPQVQPYIQPEVQPYMQLQIQPQVQSYMRPQVQPYMQQYTQVQPYMQQYTQVQTQPYMQPIQPQLYTREYTQLQQQPQQQSHNPYQYTYCVPYEMNPQPQQSSFTNYKS
jgi:hypothetical protein